MQSGERFNSISNYLKDQFGIKTVKLSIEAGFTCPNRDGTVAYGGCAFCSSSGSGEMASIATRCDMISAAIDEQIEKLSDKWPNASYLAYFQSHTNTYAPVEDLRKLYYTALSDKRIKGIVIATRPDCLGPEVLDLLDEINRDYFMWIELGLQSTHDKTCEFLNIGYPLSTYDKAVDNLIARNIKVVTHLILGLPCGIEERDGRKFAICETEAQMLESVNYVCQKPIFGLKLHLLNVVSTSALYKKLPDYVSFNSINEYVDLVIRCLEIVPPEITIHRLTADVPRSILVSPEWSFHKRTILNSINQQLVARDTYQGKALEKKEDGTLSSLASRTIPVIRKK